jgi:anti-sigma factor RsiW
MSCSPFDLRDYVLNELPDSEGRQVEAHVASCDSCREELDRLRVTQSALLAVGDEEIPQRIGFVSDQVFEPSAMRRWWQALWGSTARLGFASAAMLSIAIMVSALTRPAPAPSAPAAAPPAAQVDMAKVEARFEQRLQAAVSKAVAETEARQQENTKALLTASEERHAMEMKSIQLAVEQDLTLLQKRYNSLRLYMASADTGASR